MTSSPATGTPSSPQTDAAATAFLRKLLPAARIALWEATGDPLELVSLQFGDTPRPALPLDPTQLQAGSRWEENIHPVDRETAHVFFNTKIAGKADKHIDYRLVLGDGDLLWVRHWLLHEAPGADGRRRLVGMIMPIPEQKHLEWECLRLSERECNRIGQELHDDLCQVLAGVTFMMHVLGDRAAKLSSDLATEIRDLTDHVQSATDRVRAMAHGLFPAQVNFTNLREALLQLSKQTRTRFGVEVHLDFPRKLPQQSAAQIIQVYRIVQEAVLNAVRHGGAKSIRLVGSITGPSLHLSIEDNGKGFPAPSARPEGIGMHVMQYRARILGGSVAYKNLTSRGAAVQLVYPFSHPVGEKAQPQASQ